jgi:hypothetical protein
MTTVRTPSWCKSSSKACLAVAAVGGHHPGSACSSATSLGCCSIVEAPPTAQFAHAPASERTFTLVVPDNRDATDLRTWPGYR